MLCFVVEWRQNWLFLTSDLGNKAEITILSARDTTRAWVPGRGIIGRVVGVYKTGYNTWLSSRLQNQPRSFVSFRSIFSLFSSLVSRYHASSLVGSAVLISFVQSLRRWASNGLELEPWFLPRFSTHFFRTGFFSGRFFLASVQTAFALLVVAQLY